MRIDRDAFLLAVAALAGCERADTLAPVPAPAAHIAPATAPAPKPQASMPQPAPIPEVPAPPPITVPPPVAVHAHQSSKQWFLSLSTASRGNVTDVCDHRARKTCRAALRMGLNDSGEEAVAAAPDPTEQLVANLPKARVASYCEKDFHAPTCETPLVVAFDAQPIEFAHASDARFAFVPGDPAATDWPTATTPWIAIDLDGDGAITSGAELFGSSTVLGNGTRAVDGFAAIAALDANGDGVIDARDPAFTKLLLWTDRDGDHRSTPDELRPLASTVTAISLAFTRDARCNQRDDCEGQRASLRWRDATGTEHAGTVVDVYIPR